VRKLPVYIEIYQVAKVLGWTHYKARRWLRAANALVMRGDTMVTTPDKLRESFPEVWSELLGEIEDREANE
jgi:phage antirepressor YoqD-like protein